MSADERKVVRDSEIFYQLQSESDLYATIIPDPPKPGEAATIRITHANSYGPFEEVEFFVRIGDPTVEPEFGNLDYADDWVKAELVEELVTIDGEEMLRSEATEPLDEETLWEGTFEAQLVFPPGEHSIEIKILSGVPDLLMSMVLPDWKITV